MQILTMYISRKKQRIQIVKSTYNQSEKSSRAAIISSFKVDPRGIEVTVLPPMVFKNCKQVRIESIFDDAEIEEIKVWLDNEKKLTRVDNLQRDWMRLPLLFKRLIDALRADEVMLDDLSIDRYFAFSDFLSKEVQKKMRKEAFEKVKLLELVSVGGNHH